MGSNCPARAMISFYVVDIEWRPFSHLLHNLSTVSLETEVSDRDSSGGATTLITDLEVAVQPPTDTRQVLQHPVV